MKLLKAEEKRGCCPTLRTAQIGRFLGDNSAILLCVESGRMGRAEGHNRAKVPATL